MSVNQVHCNNNKSLTLQRMLFQRRGPGDPFLLSFSETTTTTTTTTTENQGVTDKTSICALAKKKDTVVKENEKIQYRHRENLSAEEEKSVPEKSVPKREKNNA